MCTGKCAKIIGKALFPLGICAIIANLLLYFPNGQILEVEQITDFVWFFHGIVGAGLLAFLPAFMMLGAGGDGCCANRCGMLLTVILSALGTIGGAYCVVISAMGLVRGPLCDTGDGEYIYPFRNETDEFLSTGESYASLHFRFRMGISTINKIVPHTCDTLWLGLQPLYMPQPTEEVWLESADGFLRHANFPNCIGAVDGKHIRIHKPSHSGSLYFNYKHFFSIILMAISDATYRFLAVDIGAYGQNNDSRVFKESNMGKALYSRSLGLPALKPLPGSDGPPVPHVLVGDEAFQMHENLMKPFAVRSLNAQRRVFNYRLTRARRYVECAFGLFTTKWRILTTTINVKPLNVDKLIKGCVVLHNFVLKEDPSYTAMSREIEECELVRLEPSSLRAPVSAMDVRNTFLAYFNSPQGALPWQDNLS